MFCTAAIAPRGQDTVNTDRDFGLWGATAEPAPPIDVLDGDTTTDVLIIGAGYTGLSTALHLAQRNIPSLVIDAHHPGFGASGRNGGQVLPGFKTYPDHLVATYGKTRGIAMAEFGAGIADELFALIESHAIVCAARQSGWIHAGHHVGKLSEQRWKHDQWAARGADVAWLEQGEISQLLGTSAYAGGWLDRRAGVVQPLSYARGLARAAQQLGARICSQTPATSLKPVADGWQITTPCGVIRAAQVVIATNGYTGNLLPKLAGTVVSVESAQIATQVLSDDQLCTIMPTIGCVSDTRRSLLYFRLSPDGRFVMGGRGGIALPTSTGNYDRLKREALALYPSLANVEWTNQWAGKLAVTLDHMPHLHEPAPGLIASLGCNGRGVAYSTAIGRVIAMRLAGCDLEAVPMPITQITPMPLAAFRKIGAASVAAWFGLRDKWSL